MDEQIKKYADEGNIKQLKFIFVDALDVDPTFVRYKEEYEYCKSHGVLEPHEELTPFTADKLQWDEKYWASLKADLIKNFSDKRMAHMKEVAQIFLASKIQKILADRQKEVDKKSSVSSSLVQTATVSSANTTFQSSNVQKTPEMDRNQQEKLRIEKIKQENERKRLEQEQEIKEEQRKRGQEAAQRRNQSPYDNSSKKNKLLVIGLVIIIIIIVLLMISRN